jgi:hypothetical protein
MTTFCIAFDETYLSMGSPLDTFVLPLRVTTVSADAALLGCAARTVLNAANYAPPAIFTKIRQKYKTGCERIRILTGWDTPSTAVKRFKNLMR